MRYVQRFLNANSDLTIKIVGVVANVLLQLGVIVVLLVVNRRSVLLMVLQVWLKNAIVVLPYVMPANIVTIMSVLPMEDLRRKI